MNNKIINKLKEETNNSSYIIYREKYINNTKINIIYNFNGLLTLSFNYTQ